MIPPANWELMWENICKSRKKFPAAVDSMGCGQNRDKSEKDIDQRFQVLVSLMLSSQTKDPITWAAVQKLKEKGLGNVEGILGAKEKDIEDLIYPVGFYRRKAIYLKKVAEILKKDYGGDIPSSLEGLCALPGVGPKMAHLCMMEAWDIISGIGVDTHVHRISGRLNWVPKGLKNPEDTRKALESWLPHDQWRLINHLLVGFGQTICTPVNPKCDQCFNSSICPSSSVGSKKTTKTKAAAKVKVKVKAEPKTEQVEEEEEKEENGDNETKPEKADKKEKEEEQQKTKKPQRGATNRKRPPPIRVKVEPTEVDVKEEEEEEGGGRGGDRKALEVDCDQRETLIKVKVEPLDADFVRDQRLPEESSEKSLKDNADLMGPTEVKVEQAPPLPAVTDNQKPGRVQKGCASSSNFTKAERDGGLVDERPDYDRNNLRRSKRSKVEP